MVRDIGLAEELAQDAFVAALEQWPDSGVPDRPGAWLMGTARHRAIDMLRRSKRLQLKHEQLGRELAIQEGLAAPDFDAALDDELMRRFAADRVAKVMEMVGMEEDMPLESSMVSRFIEQAQTKVEGYNFDIRKNVVDYDDVIAKQREVIYADRRAVLERADMILKNLDPALIVVLGGSLRPRAGGDDLDRFFDLALAREMVALMLLIGGAVLVPVRTLQGGQRLVIGWVAVGE